MSLEMSKRYALPKLTSNTSFFSKRSAIRSKLSSHVEMGTTLRNSDNLATSREERTKQKTLYNKWYIKPEHRYR